MSAPFGQRLIAFTARVADLDVRTSKSLFKAGAVVPRAVYKLLEYSGDGILWLVLAAAALASPLSPACRRALWINFLIGLLVDLAEVGLLKVTVRRCRPAYNALAKDMFVVVPVDHFSFPSGHSSRCAAAPTPLPWRSPSPQK